MFGPAYFGRHYFGGRYFGRNHATGPALALACMTNTAATADISNATQSCAISFANATADIDNTVPCS